VIATIEAGDALRKILGVQRLISNGSVNTGQGLIGRVELSRFAAARIQTHRAP